jgi:uncharacterized membrane protein YedE/YeeE
MKKIYIALYGLTGSAICVLAITDFFIGDWNLTRRLAMLAGLLIFGVMYIGGAVAIAQGKNTRHTFAPKPQPLPSKLVLGSSLLGILMIGWVLSTRGITLHGIAIVLTILPLLISNYLDTLGSH